ncbi:immunity protein Tsi6 family protein [Streptomyces sp. RKAG293]|uniref:immunity protein Tsi6 family protein n=1 Tax=Streptomyces sp. RKAG293 TaxID=2893403 RepID=UPI002033BE0B|nr:immunity protein Tsi6 family protein [Streptomyces sp. RKAG293]MCM2416582.1 immunity protein Tsi6 family protein [Streptomyces sp. RKAG293]
MVTTPENLPVLVEEALAMIEIRIGRSGSTGIHTSVRAQLRYMKKVLAASSRPAEEDLDSLTLGIYAAREFEASDPELANVLFEVQYLFKRL